MGTGLISGYSQAWQKLTITPGFTFYLFQIAPESLKPSSVFACCPIYHTTNTGLCRFIFKKY